VRTPERAATPQRRQGSAAQRTAQRTAKTRTNDPAATQANILEVATREFAEHGFTGARIDAIAAGTRTSKRMIYYYFGSKEGLYEAVLLEYYRRLRAAERQIELDDVPPLEAVVRLTESTFDYHIQNADVVRLVMVENLAKGRHIKDLAGLPALNSALVSALQRVCDRGAREKVMRRVDATQLYTSIAALSFFNVSNRYTFSQLFELDMTSKKALEQRRREVTEMVLRYVAP
jgi:AcrR family transcriptional regulator